MRSITLPALNVGADPHFVTDTQNYAAPVRDVLNADTITINNELGRLEIGSGDVPDKAILAPTLIDRGPQFNALVERIEGMLPEGGALLVVVPGCAADLHQALVIRCASVYFFEEFGGVGAWKNLKRLQWPEGAKSVESILRGIRDALGFKKTYRQRDIEESITRLGRHLCFSHNVDSRAWEEDDGTLVRNWVDYFAKGALKPGAGHLIVSFLCLELAKDRSPTCRRIEDYIEKVRNGVESGRGGVLVTRPLDLIRGTHVGDWASEVSRYLEDDIIETQLLDVAHSLFSVAAERRHLAEVWRHLCTAVAKAVRRRTARFAGVGR